MAQRPCVLLCALPCALLLAALLSLPLVVVREARADDVPGGLAAELPPKVTSSCPTEQQVHLQAAAGAVRAAWMPQQRPEKQEVAGVALDDDPRLLAHLRRILGDTPPRDWPKAKKCQSALCALTAATGSQEVALWLLATGADGGPVASLDQTPFRGGPESTWTDSEARLVSRALADLPPALRQRAGKLRALRRLPDGQQLANNPNALSLRPGGKDGGTILLRDTVWRMPLRQQREVIAHEVGHHLEYAQGPGYPISHSKEWLAFSGWRQVGQDPAAKDAWTTDPRPSVTNTGETVPSEEFPDAVADFRYNARLLRAHSEPRFDFIKDLYGGATYLTPRKNPALDAAMLKLGGPLGAFKDCGAMVQRAWRKPGMPQAMLYTVQWKKSGSSWTAWHRSAFVSHSACVPLVLEKLRELPAFQDLACKQDDEELWLDVAARLENVFAAYAEAAEEIEKASGAGTAQQCVQRGDLTEACLDGVKPAGDAQARRIFAELLPGQSIQPDAVAGLRKQLEAASVLAPPDDELFQRFPALASAPEFFGACLGGAFEVSCYAGKPDTWRFWVKLPPDNAVKGFPNPVWNLACHRDWAAWLKSRGILVDINGALFDHFAYLLKNQSGHSTDRFTAQVLRPYEDLRSQCGIPPGTKATPEQQPCLEKLLGPRLEGVVGPGQVAELARQLAGELRGP